MITKNQQKIKKKPYPTIQHTLYEEQKRGKLFDIDYIVRIIFWMLAIWYLASDS